MLSTAEAAEEIGVCKNTLLRWVTEGLMEDVEKDWRGWRTWSRADVDRGKAGDCSFRMEHGAVVSLKGNAF